jgi:hypothetical protein
VVILTGTAGVCWYIDVKWSVVGIAGAEQGAVASKAPDDQDDQAADDPLARFHEHQKTAARISTVEEARMLIDVNR